MTENPYAPPESNIARDETDNRLATRGERFAGALLDAILMMLVLFPIMFLFGFWEKAMAQEQSLANTLFLGFLGIAIFWVLNGYLLANNGQTIGKRIVGTRIVSISDDKILPIGKLFGLRYLPLHVLSQIPVVGAFVGLINALLIFRQDRRCGHDLIAGTKVLKVAK